ncbi:MAG: hypothetical protein AAGD10_03435 [Myxococcota bacterium]
MRTVLPVLMVGAACAGSGQAEPEPSAGSGQAEPEAGASLPSTSPAEAVAESVRSVLQRDPAWGQVYARARPSPAQLRRLEAVEPEISVLVVYGEWCSDSRREVPLYWKALDQAKVRFETAFRAVDRSKTGPGLEDLEILYVPTFVIRREGVEVGRLVESAETDLLSDLLAVMEGGRAGVLSGRPELGVSAVQKR